MKLEDFGYNEKIEKLRIENEVQDLEIGRVIVEHKERYIVKTEKGDFEAEITGNLRYSANSREDFPAVGDWVALMIYDAYTSIIHKILPRYAVLSRQAIGRQSEIQIIATNIDYALLVQAVDRDFNMNRMERYLTICNSSNVKPIMVLTKIDLISEAEQIQFMDTLQNRIGNVPLFAISNKSGKGIKKLREVIEKGKTYCLLGSSGVGKSTLLNTIAGEELMETGTISQHANRGKHVTTHRELWILKNGGIVIDNPGMREVGVTDTSEGIQNTFEKIVELSQHCKFKNCTHTTEIGCAVKEAIETGELDLAAYENYLKMEREKEHYEASVFEKRKKDKDFGKMIKQHKKSRRNTKY